MKPFHFVSTQGRERPRSFSETLAEGLAPDGGLWVPEEFPSIRIEDFTGRDAFADIAEASLKPFFAGDVLAPQLAEICRDAFSFPIPCVELKHDTSVLELFHGPTAAFKDVGARFLAECLTRLSRVEPSGNDRTILVATSGDTGGAVAAAFHGKRGTRVIILFPHKGVSPRQRQQLTCWGGNIKALAVDGTFDDCQRLAKAALGDGELRKRLRLTSANSISIGRLLPQITYYAAASLWHQRAHGVLPSFAIPSGNLGNSVAALWAKQMGFPIGSIGFATNANKEVPEYFETGRWKPRASVQTLANAMDVGNPSNMERIFHLMNFNPSLRPAMSALSVNDTAIRKTIASGEKNYGRVWCPHTATAVFFREKQKTGSWIIVATAHPAKFETIVEPLIGHEVTLPSTLAGLAERVSRYDRIGPDFKTLREYLS